MAPATYERLRASRAIGAVLRGRAHQGGALLVVRAAPTPTNETTGVARLAVVASRRVGNAVRRNRAKRLLREAARTLPWRAGVDVVLLARQRCADSTTPAVRAELELLARRGSLLQEVTDVALAGSGGAASATGRVHHGATPPRSGGRA